MKRVKSGNCGQDGGDGGGDGDEGSDQGGGVVNGEFGDEHVSLKHLF